MGKLFIVICCMIFLLLMINSFFSVIFWFLNSILYLVLIFFVRSFTIGIRIVFKSFRSRFIIVYVKCEYLLFVDIVIIFVFSVLNLFV